MDALDPDLVVSLSFRDPDRPDRPPQAVFGGRLRTALMIVRGLDRGQRTRAIITAKGLPAGGIPPPAFEEIERLAGLPD